MHCFIDSMGFFKDIRPQPLQEGSENTRGVDIRPCGLAGNPSASFPSTVFRISCPLCHPAKCPAVLTPTAQVLHLKGGSVECAVHSSGRSGWVWRGCVGPTRRRRNYWGLQRAILGLGELSFLLQS